MPGWVTCTSSSYQSPSRSRRRLGNVQPSGRFSLIATLGGPSARTAVRSFHRSPLGTMSTLGSAAGRPHLALPHAARLSSHCFSIISPLATRDHVNARLGRRTASPRTATRGAPQLALLFDHFTARLGARRASARTAIEHHARVADDALGVRPHPVSLQRATPAAESVKDGVDRRQAADAAAIPVSSDTVEERLGVAPFDRLQHLPILGLDPGALRLSDRARIV